MMFVQSLDVYLLQLEAENYSQNLKVFEEEAPRVGPCVSQQVNREKSTEKQRQEKMLWRMTPDGARPA